MGTKWADVSQYQPVVNDSYPHPLIAFRSNTGSVRDTRCGANLDWALRSKLPIIIVYYFFRPGQANCDLWREMVTRNGKIDPRIVCMVDVESGKGSSGGAIPAGDHSAEINDEVQRVQGWLGGNRVIGYYNPKADPGIWTRRPNIPLVVPHYGVAPGQSYDYPNRFAHQYTDREQTQPFGPCDVNYTDMSLEQLRTLFFGTHAATGGNNMAQPDVAWFEGFLRPLISDTKDVREQLTGGRDLKYIDDDPKKGVDIKRSFPGWAQLGNRSVVDAVAALLAGFGVEGCYDPAGKVEHGQFLKAAPAAKAVKK